MKTLILSLFVIVSFIVPKEAIAQSNGYDSTKIYLVTKNDGTEYVGKILSKDEREILIETTKVGKIYIPMHEVASIKEIEEGRISNGEYVSDDPFGTRYFITTNALALKRGEAYSQFNIYGPEVHYGVTDRLGVGVMTTWIGIPLVGDIKYSFPLNKDGNTHFAIGSLVGFGSWAAPENFGALPFASLTFGSKKSNLSFTAGGLFTNQNLGGVSQPLMSIAGLTKVTSKITLVFDSFIIIPTDNNEFVVALLTPGLRFQHKPGRAFQFGFSGIMVDGELAPIPVPNLAWFFKL